MHLSASTVSSLAFKEKPCALFFVGHGGHIDVFSKRGKYKTWAIQCCDEGAFHFRLCLWLTVCRKELLEFKIKCGFLNSQCRDSLLLRSTASCMLVLRLLASKAHSALLANAKTPTC